MKTFQDFSPHNTLFAVCTETVFWTSVCTEIVFWTLVCTEIVFWTLNRLVTSKVHYMEKNRGTVSSKILISFRLKKKWHRYLG